MNQDNQIIYYHQNGYSLGDILQQDPNWRIRLALNIGFPVICFIMFLVGIAIR